MIGTTILHYRILEKLGGGGMGVVYRCEDTKLRREVALKFLSPELSQDNQALERFQREAYAASALNHPNIATIHAIEEYEGRPFIVMELLEGRNLQQCIGARPLPTETLLDLAIQLVSALDVAHRKGIVHRDIKPENIFVIEGSQAKILDFGLAKITRPKIADALGATAATTVSLGEENLTSPGVSMGTIAYMSPEQARGEDLDARTDLFSFGAVLYQMATGRPPFSGPTSAVIFHNILALNPISPSTLNLDLPAELVRIIDKALEKDRDLRYQHASDMRSDLKRLKRATDSERSVGVLPALPKSSSSAKQTGSEKDGTATERRAVRRPWHLIVGGIIVAVLVAAAILQFRKRDLVVSPEMTVRQLTANSDENPVRNGMISPDGKYLAYCDSKGIHIKLIQSGETQSISRPEPAMGTRMQWYVGSWFPDSTRFLVTAAPPDEFVSAGQHPSIWKASVLGGPLRELRDDATAEAVSPDGSLIAFTKNYIKDGAREIWLMGANGEQPRKLYDAGDKSFVAFQWSPDGQRLSYIKANQPGAIVESRDLSGGSPATILSVSNGELLHDYIWSSDGRFIYGLEEPGGDGQRCNFWQMRIDTRTGVADQKPKRLTNWSGFCLAGPSLTADGKKLAFLRWTESQKSVYVAGLEAGGTRITAPIRLTLEEGWNQASGWTPDSKAVIFRSIRDGKWGIFAQSLSADTEEPIVTGLKRVSQHTPVSPDGKWLLYAEWVTPDAWGSSPGPDSQINLMRVPLRGGLPELIVTGQGGIRCARAPATLCVSAGLGTDRKEMVFFAFSPTKGRGVELARFNTNSDSDDFEWALSPDGTRIAVLESDLARFHMVSLNRERTQKIDVKGWSNLVVMQWAADGKGFYGSSRTPRGSTLLYVDLQGNARALWEQRGSDLTEGIPSPDGRHLAMLGMSQNHNMSMIENF